MILWERLSGADREGELELTPEEGQELDRRWMDHLQRPESSIPWDDVRRRLMERERHDGPEAAALYSTKGCR
jgi:putative addiction module component (TIGR02574 family)